MLRLAVTSSETEKGKQPRTSMFNAIPAKKKTGGNLCARKTIEQHLRFRSMESSHPVLFATDQHRATCKEQKGNSSGSWIGL
jgi:hypothetical protein